MRQSNLTAELQTATLSKLKLSAPKLSNLDPQHIENLRTLWAKSLAKALTRYDQTSASPRVHSFTEALSEQVLSQKSVADYLAQRLTASVGTTVEELSSRLRRAFVMELNNQPWERVEQVVSRPGLGDSFLNSASPFNANFEIAGEYSKFKSYGTGGKSSETQTMHWPDHNELACRVPNGWFTKLSHPKYGVLFAALRSGTLCNYRNPDPAQRKTESASMINELLHAAALVKLNSASVQDTVRWMRGEATLPLRIASFDLQSRCVTTAPPPGYGIETQNVEEQRHALLNVAGRRRLSFRDGDFRWVDVEALSFNFPVNEHSFSRGAGYEAITERRNKAALEMLVAQAHWMCTKLSGAPLHRLEYLIHEARRLCDIRDYSRISPDPYRTNAQLMNLAYHAGYVVHINCRSGKDRTAFMEAEAKLLAVRLRTSFHNRKPLPYELSDAESNLLYELAAHGPNSYIQKLNTGIPGSRLRPICEDHDPLQKRIGAARWSEFKGLAGYAHHI